MIDITALELIIMFHQTFVPLKSSPYTILLVVIMMAMVLGI